MKTKIYLLSALLVCSFVTYGCQSKTTIDPEKLKQEALSQEKRLGVIQSLGGAVNSSQATHMLRMENGKTIFLKSSIVDLNNEKYQKKDVEVSGDLIRTTDGEQVMDVKSIDIIEKEATNEDAVPQWKDYNSEKLGIKFKYKDNLQLVEKDNQVLLTGKTQKSEQDQTVAAPASTETSSPVLGVDDYTMTITFKLLSDKPDYDLLGSLGVVSDSTTDLLSKGLTKSKITLHALDAIKEADKTGNNIAYYLKVGTNTYLIKLEINKSDNLVQDQNTFYDILASVDFSSYTEQKPAIQ